MGVKHIPGIYYHDQYLNLSRHHTFVSGTNFDNPILYSEIFTNTVIFIPFFYYIILTLRSQNMFKSHSCKGVGVIYSLCVYLLAHSFTAYAFNYDYYEPGDIYYMVYETYQILHYISLFEYSYLLFDSLHIIGVKNMKIIIYINLALKYLYTIYFLFLFSLIYIPSPEFNKRITRIKPYVNEFTNYLLGFSRYLISFCLLIPKVQKYLPLYLQKYLKPLAFTLNLGFIYIKIQENIFKSKYIEFHLFHKGGFTAYVITQRCSFILVFLLVYAPLATIIYCLSVDNDHPDPDNVLELTTSLDAE